MPRRFGIASARPNLGGDEHPTARYRAITPRDSILLPAAGPAFERSQITQALIDIGAALGGFLLASAFFGGLGFIAYVIFLLFIRP